MTRRDYVAIARVFARAAGGWYEHQTTFDGYLYELASDIADVLQADNHRFDRTRFLDACGVLKGGAAQ